MVSTPRSGGSQLRSCPRLCGSRRGNYLQPLRGPPSPPHRTGRGATEIAGGPGPSRGPQRGANLSLSSQRPEPGSTISMGYDRVRVTTSNVLQLGITNPIISIMRGAATWVAVFQKTLFAWGLNHSHLTVVHSVLYHKLQRPACDGPPAPATQKTTVTIGKISSDAKIRKASMTRVTYSGATLCFTS